MTIASPTFAIAPVEQAFSGQGATFGSSANCCSMHPTFAWSHWIGGAAVDVTDPESLPDGHPLWGLDHSIITSHNANPPNLERPQMAARITENISRYLRHEPLLGVVDPQLRY